MAERNDRSDGTSVGSGAKDYRLLSGISAAGSPILSSSVQVQWTQPPSQVQGSSADNTDPEQELAAGVGVVDTSSLVEVTC